MRTSLEYKVWKEKVFKRDEYTCQYPKCGSKEKIQAHHIKKFSEHKHIKTAVFNGITLCKKCHEKIYGKEDLYAPIFFGIIKEKFKDEKKN